MSGYIGDSTENRTMRILTGIGMVLVVAGHLKLNCFDIWGLFPYYSFHVLIFVFVAGYFYDEASDSSPLKFIIHKAKRLLIPYYALNLIYGVISTILNINGIYIGSKISIYNLTIAPILGGHQFMYNSPAWFMVALFIVETMYVLSRTFLKRVVGLKNVAIDIVTTVSFLIMGIVVVYLAMQGKAWGIYRDFGRWLIMLPAIVFGRAFRVWIQPSVRLRVSLSKRYILAIVALILFLVVQFGVVKLTGGRINYSVVWCGPFATGPVMPFITMVTGIGFWYIVASLLNALPIRIPADWLRIVGLNSMPIMIHHLMVLFIINTICMIVCHGNVDTLSASGGFDMTTYTTDITYQYLYAGEKLTGVINLLMCISIPCAIHMILVKVSKKIGISK